MPDVIQFKNGNQIKNLYDAGGHKLGSEYFTWRPGANAPVVNAGDLLNISYSQASTDQSGTAYIGNFEYNTLNGNSSLTALSRIYNDEGYVENPANPQYYYFRHDHLGDNREVWCANSNTVAQRTQYYPSGLPLAYDRTIDHPDLQHRKYNGKEFVEMHGYDIYDFDHRGFYPAGCFFTTVDWKAEDTPEQSPYSYAGNNPIRYRDENSDGIGDIITGVANAFVDDANPFSNVSSIAPRDNENHYQIGQTVGHFVAAIVATDQIITGGGTALGGAGLGVVTSESGVGAVAGYGVAAFGVAEATHGAMMLKNAVTNVHGNSSDSKKPSGNYQLTHENGKTYNGVGNEKRMNQSAKNIEKKYGGKVVEKTHTPAANKKEAYIKEHNDIQKNGGAGNKEKNYNKRNSPGKKIVEGGN